MSSAINDDLVFIRSGIGDIFLVLPLIGGVHWLKINHAGVILIVDPPVEVETAC